MSDLTCDYPRCQNAVAAARMAVRNRPPKFVGLCTLHLAAFDANQHSDALADFWSWLSTLAGG